MKKITITYWIFTGLLLASMLVSSIPGIMGTKESVEIISGHLGYPTYLVAFLGWAKLLGVIAILIPGYPMLKEWVYAGFTIDLAGALYSSIAVGDPISGWATLLIGFVLIAGSYIFHHKKLSYQP